MFYITELINLLLVSYALGVLLPSCMSMGVGSLCAHSLAFVAAFPSPSLSSICMPQRLCMGGCYEPQCQECCREYAQTSHCKRAVHVISDGYGGMDSAPTNENPTL